MIEIVLNPDNEIIGGEVLDHGDDRGDEADREMAAKTAERFLKEVTFKNNNSKYILMENSILVASGARHNIKRLWTNCCRLSAMRGTKCQASAQCWWWPEPTC